MIRCCWSVVLYASAVHVLLKQFYQSLQQEISMTKIHVLLQTMKKWNIISSVPAGTGNQPPRSTQSSITPGSVNEYQLWLERIRQVWFIPLADERGVCR